MKSIVFILCSLLSLTGFSQAKKVYRVADQVVIQDVATSSLAMVYASQVGIFTTSDGKIRMSVGSSANDYALTDFQNQNGAPYSTISPATALINFATAIPVATGGSSGTGTAGVTSFNGQSGVVNYTPSYSSLTGVPSTFAPSAHTHAASDITSGIFAPARLGSGTAGTGTYLRGDGLWTTFPTISGANTGDQQLLLSGTTLTIGGANGNSVTLPQSVTNNNQLTNGAGYLGATDRQLVLNGTQLSVTGPNGTTVTLPTSTSGGASTTVVQAATTTGIALARTGAGFVIPQFRTTDRFDYDGAALPANQLAIHSSGVGLVSAVGGTFSDGYIKLGTEILPQNRTRTDARVIWDCNEVGASTTFILGPASNGYAVTIANSGTNVVTTMPSGATTAAPLSGTVVFGVSFATANFGITSSVSILGTTLPTLATTNPYRAPIYEWNLCTKQNLWSLYLRTNAASCRVEGALFNPGNWNGDPAGQLLTRSVVLHSVGAIGQFNTSGVATQPRDHDSFIFIPEIPNPSARVPVVHFWHGRTQKGNDFFNITQLDNAESARSVWAKGHIIIASSGGPSSITREQDPWGNATSVARANELYTTTVANIANVGGESMVVVSMGGCGFNYAKEYLYRIKAVWANCPVLDLEETGTGSLQANTTLTTSLKRAYAIWYTSRIASNTNDPQTDNNTTWRQVSAPGDLPTLGMRSAGVVTVATSATNTVIPTFSLGGVLNAGDVLYFQGSGTTATVAFAVTGSGAGSYQLNTPVTVAAGEPVVVYRQDSKPMPGYSYSIRNDNEWTASSTNPYTLVWRTGANWLADIKPHNPMKFVDVIAAAGFPIHIGAGGDGTENSNDGILNATQWWRYMRAVNAIRPGQVTIVSGTQGSHTAASTWNATDLVNLFESVRTNNVEGWMAFIVLSILAGDFARSKGFYPVRVGVKPIISLRRKKRTIA